MGDALFSEIHHYLSVESYWARGIPAATLLRAVSNSLSVVVTKTGGEGEKLVGFARIVTDRATYAYLCDVFVLPAAQEKGFARAMLHAIDAHPDLQGLRRYMLMTRDAHALYAKFGYVGLRDPYMDAPGLQEQSFHDDDDTRSRLQPYIRSLLQPSI
ncbi:MAG: GNAT family N-acetyltransferase, partial [Rhodocyclaceae bacterium]|nr:GNAT family N-acetyltransferase [Rhodocyclaceae bacterium]